MHQTFKFVKKNIGLKTLCEKEKMLGTSIFSFPHNVFKSFFLQGRKDSNLFGKKGLRASINCYLGQFPCPFPYPVWGRSNLSRNFLIYMRVLLCEKGASCKSYHSRPAGAHPQSLAWAGTFLLFICFVLGPVQVSIHSMHCLTNWILSIHNKPVLEIPSIKRPPALKDHFSDTTTPFLNQPNITCI